MKYVILLLALLGAAGRPAGAAEPDLVARQKVFVKELFAQKRYFDAIAETRRLMAFDPAIRLNPDYEFFINANYFLGGQYGTAVKNLAAKSGPRELREDILLSQSYLKLGMRPESLNAVINLRYGPAPSSGYALLARKAEACIENGMYAGLLDEIAAAESYVGEREKLALLREEIARYRELHRRSVPLAVALSVFIPGAGQMYAGRYILGAASFAGVATTAGLAYYFHRREKNDLCYAFIFLSSLFYLGNIYGAFNAAETANRDMESSFRETVRKKCIPEYDPAEDMRVERIFR